MSQLSAVAISMTSHAFFVPHEGIFIFNHTLLLVGDVILML